MKTSTVLRNIFAIRRRRPSRIRALKPRDGFRCTILYLPRRIALANRPQSLSIRIKTCGVDSWSVRAPTVKYSTSPRRCGFTTRRYWATPPGFREERRSYQYAHGRLYCLVDVHGLSPSGRAVPRGRRLRQGRCGNPATSPIKSVSVFDKQAWVVLPSETSNQGSCANKVWRRIAAAANKRLPGSTCFFCTGQYGSHCQKVIRHNVWQKQLTCEESLTTQHQENRYGDSKFRRRGSSGPNLNRQARKYQGQDGHAENATNHEHVKQIVMRVNGNTQRSVHQVDHALKTAAEQFFRHAPAQKTAGGDGPKLQASRTSLVRITRDPPIVLPGLLFRQ